MKSWGEAMHAGVTAAFDMTDATSLAGVRVRTVRDGQGDAEVTARLTVPRGRGPRVCLRARAMGDRACVDAWVEVYVIGREGAGVGDPAELSLVNVPPTMVMDTERWKKATRFALDRAGAILGAAADACGFWAQRRDTTNGANDDDQPVGGEGVR